MLTHSLIQYLTLPATPPSPVALAAGVRFIHKARLYEREIKDSLSPITRIVTVPIVLAGLQIVPVRTNTRVPVHLVARTRAFSLMVIPRFQI